MLDAASLHDVSGEKITSHSSPDPQRLEAVAGKEFPKYDFPPAQRSGSPDYAVVSTKQASGVYATVEKKSAVAQKSSPILGIASRLRHSENCSQSSSQFIREYSINLVSRF